ncbi:AsmA-like C-terminal domain-containing protein [Desulfatitalea tepidiphila]|uniref:AsmA-like C-terminal domain-containing protein n=1 Tax=Desulfatitalea tepidiphila TaxID=1185843 RepID=UPI0006B65AC9|nr:AsmA-like C-terminal domain-containing protein [Desulfatitalea tepidiphila]
MVENPLKRAVRWGLWGAGALVALVLGLHFLLPSLLNIEAVKTKVLALAGQTIPGRIDIDRLRPGLFPLPHLLLVDVHYALPESLQLDAAAVIVYPQVIPLLTGRLRPGAVIVQSPTLSLTLPRRQDQPPDAMAMLAPSADPRMLKAVLARIPQECRVDIDNARVTLRHGPTASVRLDSMSAALIEEDDAVVLRIEGRGDLAGEFDIEAELDRQTLDGSGRIRLKRLDTDALAAVVQSGPAATRLQAEPDLDVKFETEGFETWRTKFSFSSPNARLKRDEGRIEFKSIAIEGSLLMTPEQLEVVFTRVKTATPKAELNGELTWQRDPAADTAGWQLSMKARDTDVTRLRRDMLAFLPDLQLWTLLNVIRGGTLDHMMLTSSGGSWEELWRTGRMTISGEAGDTRLFIPGPDLHLTDVSGQWQMKNGVLTTRKTSARMGKTRGQDGNLELDLTEDPLRLKLDIRVVAALSEWPPILARVLSGPGAQAELARLKALEGTVSGRLGLSGDVNNLEVRVTADDIALTADHDRLPAPIRIESGTCDAWLSRGRMGLRGDFKLPQELAISAEFTLPIDGADLQRLSLTDEQSSATFTASHDRARKQLDVRFSGHLARSTLAKVWPQDNTGGWIKGDVTAQVAYAHPMQITATGPLEASEVRLPLPSAPAVDIHRAALDLRGDTLAIALLDLSYAGQRCVLSGDARLDENRIELALALDSESLDLDPLLAAYRQVKEKPATDRPEPRQTPVFRGVIEMRIDRMTVQQRIFDSLRATAELKDNQSTVTLKQGRLCGISARGELRWTPAGWTMEIEPYARQQAVQYSGGCLVGGETTERVEGTFDVSGRLSSSGQNPEEIMRRLQGVIDLKAYDGKIVNVGGAGIFTNILTYLTINKLIAGDLPDLRERDFKYNRIDMQLQIKDNRIDLYQADLLADSLNMVAAGTIHMDTRQLDLDVLVSPLTTVDALVRHLPLVGRILKGTLVAVPVGVTGPFHNPRVIPLSPKAIGSRLVGILEEILKTPFQLIEPILPSSNDDNKDRSRPQENAEEPPQTPAP